MIEDGPLQLPTEPQPDPGASRRDRMVRIAVELQHLGVSGRLITELLTYDLADVEQQLKWLPARKARKPASMIVAAIRNSYEQPADYLEEAV